MCLSLFALSKLQIPYPSLQKQYCLKIAPWIVLAKRNLRSLKSRISFLLLELKEDFLHHRISFTVTNRLNKTLVFPVMPQSLLYSPALSPFQRFTLISGQRSISTLRGAWPPEGKASSRPWDPVFLRLSFAFPTLALRIPLWSNKLSWYWNVIAVISSLAHSSFFLVIQ